MTWTDPTRYPNSAEIANNEDFLNVNVIDNLVYLKANAAPFSVFTNEAARDAAITSPTEGMIAYLTAPTVPAATGGSTTLPSGVRTIYNGAVWVCVTPVGASTSDSGTTSSTSYTPTLSGSPGTNPSVTLVTGTSVMIALAFNGVNNISGNQSNMSVAVSGATTLGAGTGGSTEFSSIATREASFSTVSRTVVIPGLTAGTNTFTLNYLVSSGTTGTFNTRSISAYGIA